jgi:hypothetical protein
MTIQITFLLIVIMILLTINNENENENKTEHFSSLSSTMTPLCPLGYILGPKATCYKQLCGLHYVFDENNYDCYRYRNPSQRKPQTKTSQGLCPPQYKLDINQNSCVKR